MYLNNILKIKIIKNIKKIKKFEKHDETAQRDSIQ
jgi:hypothetical protein